MSSASNHFHDSIDCYRSVWCTAVLAQASSLGGLAGFPGEKGGTNAYEAGLLATQQVEAWVGPRMQDQGREHMKWSMTGRVAPIFHKLK